MFGAKKKFKGYPKVPRLLDKQRHKLLEDGLVDEYFGGAQAHLALVDEGAAHEGVQSAGHGAVWVHYRTVLAPHLGGEHCINPLTPRRTLVSPFSKISILF